MASKADAKKKLEHHFGTIRKYYVLSSFMYTSALNKSHVSIISQEPTPESCISCVTLASNSPKRSKRAHVERKN